MADSIFPVELQRDCGCPVEPWRYGKVCQDHATARVMLRERSDDWYARNCCPGCGRVNGADRHGRAHVCQNVERFDCCGVTSCERHEMVAYRLKIACPRLVNPRTKHGRAFLAALATWGAPMPKAARKPRKQAA